MCLEPWGCEFLTVCLNRFHMMTLQKVLEHTFSLAVTNQRVGCSRVKTLIFDLEVDVSSHVGLSDVPSWMQTAPWREQECLASGRRVRLQVAQAEPEFGTAKSQKKALKKPGNGRSDEEHPARFFWMSQDTQYVWGAIHLRISFESTREPRTFPV